MIKELDIRVSPKNFQNTEFLKREIAKSLNIHSSAISSFEIVRKSIDARKTSIKYQLKIQVYINEVMPKPSTTISYKNVANAKPIHIIGAGPAGLFAALQALEDGFKPIIFERGKTVRDRRRDLAALNKESIVNPESNYCFGEGGAGTYSDGKLYTRSNKRGDINKILETLVIHGAEKDILIEAHPHIGTNKLPSIIENIREVILKNGGEIHFNAKLTDIDVEDMVKNKKGVIKQIEINGTQKIPVEVLILATGHSARDIFELLHNKKITIEVKPFALGVRIEHPQALINKIQYSNSPDIEFLPPASYSLVAKVDDRSVYSFCMCPGGIIAPCATNPGEIVTNGWSPSKRNNPFANSGVVVELKQEDFVKYEDKGALAGMYFQQEIEQKAFKFGNGTQKAPAQTLTDFLSNKKSETLPDCSYTPGIVSVELKRIFPEFIINALKNGLKQFCKKMPLYYSKDAVLVAPESRTSSPVRIPRDKETLQHIEIKNLYPCAEGAGYAGGIMSASIDGQRCVKEIVKVFGLKSKV